MQRFIGGLFASTAGILYFGLMIGGFVGWAYWMWVSIQIGSFMMFAFGLLGPLGVIAGLLGLWALLFGMPVWLVKLIT